MRVFHQNNNVFKLLFGAISEGIVVVDKNQVIVATNKATDKMFGYERGELVGKTLNTLIPDQFHNVHQGYFKGFYQEALKKRQMGGVRSVCGKRKDSTEFPAETGLNPFQIGGEGYIMALIVDISERKEKEQEIVALNARLEQKITERTAELKKTVADLRQEMKRREIAEHKIKESLKHERELNELKTKFLSMVSHEFKTPLSGIMTSAALAKKYTKTEQQEKRKKHLDTIAQKVKYLDNILNDFLSIERLETGKVQYRKNPFSIVEIVENTIGDFRMLLKEGQKINVSYQEKLTTIISDDKIVELIISNLLHNAIKYSGEYSTIEISVSLKNNNLSISVCDEGIGIPEEEQKFIFKRYYRAENALLDQGTGIGLNIVKTHLENLGGNIIFTSKQNEGTSFWVVLPVKT
ncbi:ATP-binding protein [Aquimarina hainanensis]|uniref:histidine kinase n=1 Tax=Aquimarina hainanensis TaxID=1578017 RepID=A0ABW5N1J1_9FLAO